MIFCHVHALSKKILNNNEVKEDSEPILLKFRVALRVTTPSLVCTSLVQSFLKIVSALGYDLVPSKLTPCSIWFRIKIVKFSNPPHNRLRPQRPRQPSLEI